MPKLIFSGIQLEELKEISKPLVDALSRLTLTDREHFTLEYVDKCFVFDGEVVPAAASVDVRWFDRPLTMQDEVAVVVDQAIRDKGYEFVEVIFTVMNKRGYYEDAEHL
jgi:hypothetical protein